MNTTFLLYFPLQYSLKKTRILSLNLIKSQVNGVVFNGLPVWNEIKDRNFIDE